MSNELKLAQNIDENVETLVNVWNMSGKLASRGLLLRALLDKECVEILKDVPRRLPFFNKLFSKLPAITEGFFAYLQFYVLYWLDQNITIAMHRLRQRPNAGWETILGDVPPLVQQELPLLIYRILQIKDASSRNYPGLKLIVEALPGTLVRATKAEQQPGLSAKELRMLRNGGSAITYEYKLDMDQAGPILQRVAEMITADRNTQVLAYLRKVKNMPYEGIANVQLVELIVKHLSPGLQP